MEHTTILTVFRRTFGYTKRMRLKRMLLSQGRKLK